MNGIVISLQLALYVVSPSFNVGTVLTYGALRFPAVVMVGRIATIMKTKEDVAGCLVTRRLCSSAACRRVVSRGRTSAMISLIVQTTLMSRAVKILLHLLTSLVVPASLCSIVNLKINVCHICLPVTEQGIVYMAVTKTCGSVSIFVTDPM